LQCEKFKILIVRKFYLLFIAIILFGCTKEDPDDIEDRFEIIPSYQDRLLTELNVFLENFYPGTKSSDLGIKDFYTLTSQKTKTDYRENIPDTIMHIINFRDGYAVMGHNLPSNMLAFVEKGDLDISFFENVDIDKYLVRSEANDIIFSDEEEYIRDMTDAETMNFISEMLLISSVKFQHLQSQEVLESKSDFVFNVGPLLNIKWPQTSPFNTWISFVRLHCCRRMF